MSIMDELLSEVTPVETSVDNIEAITAASEAADVEQEATTLLADAIKLVDTTAYFETLTEKLAGKELDATSADLLTDALGVIAVGMGLKEDTFDLLSDEAKDDKRGADESKVQKVKEFIKRVGLAIAKWFRKFMALVQKWTQKLLITMSASEKATKELADKLKEAGIEKDPEITVPEGILATFGRKTYNGYISYGKFLKAQDQSTLTGTLGKVYETDDSEFDKFVKDNNASVVFAKGAFSTTAYAWKEETVDGVKVITNVKSAKVKFKDAKELKAGDKVKVSNIVGSPKDLLEDIQASKDEMKKDLDANYKSIQDAFKETEDLIKSYEGKDGIKSAYVTNAQKVGLVKAKAKYQTMIAIAKSRSKAISLGRQILKDLKGDDAKDAASENKEEK